DYRLVVMTSRQRLVGFEHQAKLATKHRDLVDRSRLCGAGEQADEALLTDYVTRVVELFHPYVVHAPHAVNGGLGVCLGDDQHSAALDSFAQLGRHGAQRYRLTVATTCGPAEDA